MSAGIDSAARQTPPATVAARSLPFLTPLTDGARI